MSQQPVVISGITADDIRKILDECVAKYTLTGAHISSVIWLDASYLYQVARGSDFDYLSKLAKLTRYSFSNAVEYHRMLERWYQDQTVRNDRGMEFKPMAIKRTFDKVPNEGLKELALAYVGQSSTDFNWHGLGKGTNLTQAYASDKTLVDEIERIDVWQTPGGGSLGTDGTTIIAVGNHTIDMPGAGEDVTESALFNVEDKTKDLMGDHSIWPDGIPHTQGDDAMGSSTIIYNCSV